MKAVIVFYLLLAHGNGSRRANPMNLCFLNSDRNEPNIGVLLM